MRFHTNGTAGEGSGEPAHTKRGYTSLGVASRDMILLHSVGNYIRFK